MGNQAFRNNPGRWPDRRVAELFLSHDLLLRLHLCQTLCRNKSGIFRFQKVTDMSHLTRRTFLAASASAIAAAPFAMDCVAQSAIDVATPGRAPFAGIVPAPWALDVTRMSFLAPGLAPDAAKIGVQVVHGNAVWPYYPLRRDGGGLSDADKLSLTAIIIPRFVTAVRARKHIWRKLDATFLSLSIWIKLPTENIWSGAVRNWKTTTASCSSDSRQSGPTLSL